ncbi:hypothetical protein G6F59_017605 [Rhizopus arrhizus]|nr:hypothetical protein G6F59_017605 [Rhizopus arrhizus]
MGHETVGAVVAAGPDASGLSGDLNYLVYPWIGCGKCPSCVSGMENHCSAPACLGVHRAGVLLTTGSLVPAEQALQIGLVDELAEGDLVVARAPCTRT